MTILVPMAGGNDAFKEKGYAHVKWLVEIRGKPMVEHVWENLRPLQATKCVFVIRKEDAARHRLADVLRLMDPGASIVQTENPTGGAACTALLGIAHLDPEDELIITNGDQLLQADLSAIVAGFRARNLDAGAIVFDSVHPRWSFLRTNEEGLVVEAAEKRPISRHATAGFYYFKHARDFIDAAMNMIRKDANVNGMFFVCPAFNEMVLKHARIGLHQIPRQSYRSLGTPQDVEQFEKSEG
jgi:dTDP-glucose pyrophosphorylase